MSNDQPDRYLPAATLYDRRRGDRIGAPVTMYQSGDLLAVADQRSLSLWHLEPDAPPTLVDTFVRLDGGRG